MCRCNSSECERRRSFIALYDEDVLKTRPRRSSKASAGDSTEKIEQNKIKKT
jgi:hypothetical protein